MRMRLTASLVATAPLVLPCLLHGQERKIQRSELPVAVERAVATMSQGATITGFTQEVENGQTRYEMALTVGGRKKDVLMDAAGTVVEIEEEVTWASLPAAVQAGLKAKAAGGKIGKVETLTK